MNSSIKNVVFLVSLLITVTFAAFAIFGGQYFSSAALELMNFLEIKFGWLYLLSMFFFVLFSVCVALGPYGSKRLGNDSDRPEHSTAAWLAMLFCAGMGVGLVFWGVAEPVSHFIAPATGIEPASDAAAMFSMEACFMHWGFQPWAAYAVVGLGLAYAHFRKKRPLLVSSLVTPILGGKTKSLIIQIVDILAAIVTVAGIATSLGLGCLQISAGLENLFGIQNNAITWIIVIMLVGIIFIISAITGVDKGVKHLSSINAILALLLALVVFIIGPTLLDINIFTTALGAYLQNFLSSSLDSSPFGDNTWLIEWRIFYWAWWIAWAPFVGLFIAKISKGRTIREFVLGVLIAPAFLSMIWFAIFGGAGLSFAETMPLDTLIDLSLKPENLLFIVLNSFPFGSVVSVFALIIVIIFFITSADSATYVLSVISSKGHSVPGFAPKIAWGIAQLGIAIALLLAGGIKTLQTVSIAAAFPFMIVMIVGCISLLKELNSDFGKINIHAYENAKEVKENA